jgi:hypothetical protein
MTNCLNARAGVNPMNVHRNRRLLCSVLINGDLF